MSARSFKLDTAAVKEALPEQTGVQRIKEPGAHEGRIRIAFYEQGQYGAEFFNIMFESDDGKEIGPLSICTHGNNGEPTYGYGLVQTILTCAKVRELAPANGEVEIWDRNERALVSRQKEVYPALSGKKIGLFLRGEEWENNEGKRGIKLAVNGAFEHGTRLMADEILAQSKTPERYARKLEWLLQNPVKPLKQQANGRSHQVDEQYSDADLPF